jgi:hypothetical protein
VKIRCTYCKNVGHASEEQAERADIGVAFHCPICNRNTPHEKVPEGETPRKKYSVLLTPEIKVRIDDIEADSREEAVKKATEYWDEVACEVVNHMNHRGGKLDKVRYTENAEDETHITALVDEEGDEEFNNSTWYLYSRHTEKTCPLLGNRELTDHLDKFIEDNS